MVLRLQRVTLSATRQRLFLSLSYFFPFSSPSPTPPPSPPFSSFFPSSFSFRILLYHVTSLDLSTNIHKAIVNSFFSLCFTFRYPSHSASSYCVRASIESKLGILWLSFFCCRFLNSVNLIILLYLDSASWATLLTSPPPPSSPSLTSSAIYSIYIIFRFFIVFLPLFFLSFLFQQQTSLLCHFLGYGHRSFASSSSSLYVLLYY